MSAKPKLCKQSHFRENHYERQGRLELRRRDQNMRVSKLAVETYDWTRSICAPNSIVVSKYMPHQGKRECARRFVQMFAA